MQTENVSNTISREDLRAKLRDKINNKKNQRSTPKINRKKLNNYTDKLKKICALVDKHGINVEEPELPADLVESVKTVVAEEEMKDLIDYLKTNNTSKLNESMIKFLQDIHF